MIKDEEYRKIKKNILNLMRPFKDPILWPKIKFAYFYFNVSEKKCYPRNQIKIVCLKLAPKLSCNNQNKTYQNQSSVIQNINSLL